MWNKLEEVRSTYISEEERNKEGQGRQGVSAAKATTLEQPSTECAATQA